MRTFVSSYFLLFINDAGSPSRDLSTGSLQTPYCAHRLIRRICTWRREQEACLGMCHPRTEIGMHYPQQIQFCRHSQRNNGCKLTSNRRLQTDTGEYKKRNISLTQSIMVCET